MRGKRGDRVKKLASGESFVKLAT